jgi:hypothetical protein
MKGKMKFLMLCTLFLSLGMMGCEDKKSEEQLTIGVYSEVSPVKGRYKIEVINDGRLDIITEGTREELNYSIINKTIRLGSVNGEGSSEHYFRKINNSKFEIGALYIHLMYDDVPNMIFEK